MKEQKYEKVRKIDNKNGMGIGLCILFFGFGVILGNVGNWDISGYAGIGFILMGLFFMWLSTKVYWRKVK